MGIPIPDKMVFILRLSLECYFRLIDVYIAMTHACELVVVMKCPKLSIEFQENYAAEKEEKCTHIPHKQVVAHSIIQTDL